MSKRRQKPIVVKTAKKWGPKGGKLLYLEADEILKHRTGHFEVKMIYKLAIPKILAETCKREGMQTAEELISFMQSFPSTIAGEFHWTIDEVNQATNALKTYLSGIVEVTFLNRPPTIRHGRGIPGPPPFED